MMRPPGSCQPWMIYNSGEAPSVPNALQKVGRKRCHFQPSAAPKDLHGASVFLRRCGRLSVYLAGFIGVRDQLLFDEISGEEGENGRFPIDSEMSAGFFAFACPGMTEQLLFYWKWGWRRRSAAKENWKGQILPWTCKRFGSGLTKTVRVSARFNANVLERRQSPAAPAT